LEGVLDRANGLHAACSESTTAYRQQAEARLILGKDLDRTLLSVGVDGAQLVKIRRLKGCCRISVFLYGWGVAL
jgi:hypothetical protein